MGPRRGKTRTMVSRIAVCASARCIPPQRQARPASANQGTIWDSPPFPSQSSMQCQLQAIRGSPSILPIIRAVCALKLSPIARGEASDSHPSHQRRGQPQQIFPRVAHCWKNASISDVKATRHMTNSKRLFRAWPAWRSKNAAPRICSAREYLPSSGTERCGKALSWCHNA